MADPTVAALKPYIEHLQAGETYYWCRCGKSDGQPFCDGSHTGSEFTPVEYTAPKDQRVFFCGCKHTRTPPFCDGSHKDLK